MEDLLDLYEKPYNPAEPVICMDERPYQLLDHVEPPLPLKAGQPQREDYQYEREGTAAILVAVEPLTGRRWVEVRPHRTKQDYAEFMANIAQQFPPEAKIQVVQDNLNTHSYGAFYETFEPEQAHALANQFQFHFTPVHASWLNMAEIEISAISRTCLNQRLPTLEALQQEVAACVAKRNLKEVKITWRFTTPMARQTLKRHYDKIKTK
jgi:hypothetical protein